MRALDAAAQADLEEVVSRDVDAVSAILAGLSPAEPVFATCLHYEQDSAEVVDVAAVYVGVESDRQRVLAAPAGRVDVFCAVWNPDRRHSLGRRDGDLDVGVPPNADGLRDWTCGRPREESASQVRPVFTACSDWCPARKRRPG